MFIPDSTATVIQLTKNGGEGVVSVYSNHMEAGYHTESGGAILALEEGERVWLQFGYNDGVVHGHVDYIFTTFSGVLLQEL